VQDSRSSVHRELLWESVWKMQQSCVNGEQGCVESRFEEIIGDSSRAGIRTTNGSGKSAPTDSTVPGTRRDRYG